MKFFAILVGCTAFLAQSIKINSVLNQHAQETTASVDPIATEPIAIS